MGRASAVSVGVAALESGWVEPERSGASALQITLSWGGTVLKTIYLSPPRDFTVGEACGPDAPAGWIVPHRALGTKQWLLVTCDGDEVTLRVPAQARLVTLGDRRRAAPSPVRVPAARPGDTAEDAVRCLRLDVDDEARLDLGDFTLRVAHMHAVRRTPRTFGSWLDRPTAFSLSLTAAVMAALLGAMAWTQPAWGLMADETDAYRLRLVQQYLSAAAEREQALPCPDGRPLDPTRPPENADGPAGERAKGEEGKLGSSVSRATRGRVGVQGQWARPDPHLARSAALREASEFGLIGLLSAGARGDPDAPTTPWGRETSAGRDRLSARGNLWSEELGAAFGGGLGLSGIGEGGGGLGEGIGLGKIGHGWGCSCGQGRGQGWGNGRVRDTHRSHAPRVRTQPPNVSGQLPAAVVQRIVTQSQGQVRSCYAEGLARQPALAGQISVRFVIDREGQVSHVAGGGSDLPDAAVIRCVVAAFYGLSFPKPLGGIVTVNYPLRFSPG